MLVAGAKFYGTFHPTTSQLTLFSLAGEPLDTIDLRKRFGFASAFVTAVSADGDRIAIGFRHTLQVLVYRVRGVES
jgi:hypothetical protein